MREGCWGGARGDHDCAAIDLNQWTQINALQRHGATAQRAISKCALVPSLRALHAFKCLLYARSYRISVQDRLGAGCRPCEPLARAPQRIYEQAGIQS